jgi:hypothetical protein
MRSTKYDLSFTKGSLLHREASIVLSCYLESKNWVDTRIKIVEKNLLHKQSKNTITTIYLLLKKRLQHLTEQEMAQYFSLNVQQQKQLLWLACCRCHPILGDFCVEVVHDQIRKQELEITQAKYWVFYENKSHQFPRLSTITKLSRSGIRSKTFSMLRQVGIMTAKNKIEIIILTPEINKLIVNNNPEELLWFPILFENSKPIGN